MSWSGRALADEATGRISSVQPDKHELVLTDDAGKNVPFQVEKDARVIINDSEAKLSDLQIGDVVLVVHERQSEKLMVREVRCRRD
jgi:Cu/Ag efflux protein CusF